MRSAIQNGIRFVSVRGGVRIYYPCGVKRFISKSWYSDIDVFEL